MLEVRPKHPMPLSLRKPGRRHLGIGEALLGLAGTAVALSGVLQALFGLQVPTVFGQVNPQFGMLFMAVAVASWAVVLFMLVVTRRGRAFLTGPASSKRARLSAAELPNNLVIAGLVAAVLAFVPQADATPTLTVALITALAAFITAWAVGSSGKYRASAFAVAEAMHWIGLVSFSAAVLQVRQVTESGTSFAIAAIASVALTLYSAWMAIALWGTTEQAPVESGPGRTP